jgi:dehydrogenase/reductase SDR family member 12
MRCAGRVVDAALEATVACSFSRAGIAIRSRLLPEFTTDDRPSLAGRVVVVTGATSGLGQAAATELARRGGTVHFLARDQGRAARRRRQIIAETGNSSVSYGIADLADSDSVVEFALGFAARHDRLDVLIHNAGAMFDRYQLSEAGTELTFAAQVAGPFALTALLLPQLRAAAPSRVIVVSSGGMYGQPLARSLTPMGPSDFRGVTAYARAKRAQVALNTEWARRIPATDIAFHAMHPGWADTPGLAASLPTFRRILGPALRTPAEGADTAVWLATARPQLLGTGRLWHDRRPRREHLTGQTRPRDSALAAALWDQLACLVPKPPHENSPKSTSASVPGGCACGTETST